MYNYLLNLQKFEIIFFVKLSPGLLKATMRMNGFNGSAQSTLADPRGVKLRKKKRKRCRFGTEAGGKA